MCLAADPQAGTWKLNESKSKITPGTLKNTQVVYSSMFGQVKVTSDGIDANGKPMHVEWSGKVDGKDYPLTGDPNSDTRSYTKVNDRTLTTANKKNGKIRVTGQIVISADGKTRTITVTGTTPKGKKFRPSPFTTNNKQMSGLRAPVGVVEVVIAGRSLVREG